MISKELAQCAEDMRQAAQSGKISLEACVRAYDLLDKLSGIPDVVVSGPAEAFREEYYTLETDLSNAYDEVLLKEQAEKAVAPFVKELEAAAEKARKATMLHEAAKQTFELWRTGGFFERNKALRNLRQLAGFRLESNRIGNFVAKSFDLMNEANMKCAHAQRALFDANVSYKIKPGLYSKIASVLSGR
jgi:hypothetical protein